MFRPASMSVVAGVVACFAILKGVSCEAQSSAHVQKQAEENCWDAGSRESAEDGPQRHQALLQRNTILQSRPGTVSPHKVDAAKNGAEQSSKPAGAASAAQLDTDTLGSALATASIHMRAGALAFQAKAKMYDEILDKITDLGAELGPGTSAPLDQGGYEEIVKLKDPQQMEFFVRRVISQLGFRVKDYHGLLGFIPFYDGERLTQSFDTLRDEIKRTAETQHGWVTNEVSGASAPLTQDGYAQVAILANNREMAEFVRRVVSDLGLSVENEGGLQGLSEWYSGDKATSTFSDLQGELINASKHNNSWLSKSHPCPGTGHPDETELEEMQGNSSWAGKKNVSKSSDSKSDQKSVKKEASTGKATSTNVTSTDKAGSSSSKEVSGKVSDTKKEAATDKSSGAADASDNDFEKADTSSGSNAAKDDPPAQKDVKRQNIDDILGPEALKEREAGHKETPHEEASGVPEVQGQIMKSEEVGKGKLEVKNEQAGNTEKHVAEKAGNEDYGEIDREIPDAEEAAVQAPVRENKVTSEPQAVESKVSSARNVEQRTHNATLVKQETGPGEEHWGQHLNSVDAKDEGSDAEEQESDEESKSTHQKLNSVDAKTNETHTEEQQSDEESKATDKKAQRETEATASDRSENRNGQNAELTTEGSSNVEDQTSEEDSEVTDEKSQHETQATGSKRSETGAGENTELPKEGDSDEESEATDKKSTSTTQETVSHGSETGAGQNTELSKRSANADSAETGEGDEDQDAELAENAGESGAEIEEEVGDREGKRAVEAAGKEEVAGEALSEEEQEEQENSTAGNSSTLEAVEVRAADKKEQSSGAGKAKGVSTTGPPTPTFAKKPAVAVEAVAKKPAGNSSTLEAVAVRAADKKEQSSGAGKAKGVSTAGPPAPTIAEKPAVNQVATTHASAGKVALEADDARVLRQMAADSEHF